MEEGLVPFYQAWSGRGWSNATNSYRHRAWSGHRFSRTRLSRSLGEGRIIGRSIYFLLNAGPSLLASLLSNGVGPF